MKKIMHVDLGWMPELEAVRPELIVCLGDRRFPEEAQQNMLGYVRELDSRIAVLPSEVKADLDPEQIARMLGESLRQTFLQSGMPDAVRGMQATSVAVTGVQKELSTVLRDLSDSRIGVAARVEAANSRVTYSLERRTAQLDALLHEFKSDLLRIWIRLITGAAMSIWAICGDRNAGLEGRQRPFRLDTERSSKASSIPGQRQGKSKRKWRQVYKE